MPDFFRDQIWVFIGVLITLLAIVVPIYLYILQKRKKSLSYYVLSDNDLISVNEQIKRKIKITFGKVQVQNIHLLVLRIANTGNVPITPADYIEYLTISFGDDTRILSSDIIDVFPKILKPSISIYENSVLLDKLLLNRKDYFTIQLLLTDYSGFIEINYRIIGVGAINRLDLFSQNYFEPLLGTFIAILVSLFLYYNGNLPEWLYMPFPIIKLYSFIKDSFIFSFIPVILLFIYYLIKYIKSKKGDI